MDPQLRDLIDAGPMAYANGMYPSVAPAFGQIDVAPGDWTPGYSNTFSLALEGIPPSMTEGRPLVRRTTLDSGFKNPEHAGLYTPGLHYISGVDPWVLPHEFGHAMDWQGSATGGQIGAPQLSSDPRFDFGALVQDPFYQRWRPWYGEEYTARIAPEILAEEGANMMGGQPSRLSPEAQAFLLTRQFQIPQGTPYPGPYLPGSTAQANHEQYQRYLQSRRPGGW